MRRRIEAAGKAKYSDGKKAAVRKVKEAPKKTAEGEKKEKEEGYLGIVPKGPSAIASASVFTTSKMEISMKREVS